MAETTGPKNRKQNHNVKGVLRAERARKKAEAEARKEKRDKLTVAQRIAELDTMFGVGLGAKAERARLLNPKPKAAPTVPKTEPKLAEPAPVKTP